jgi:excisionase family DNA binding protein
MTRDKKEARRYLTTTQAARLAHLSPSTLLRAVQGKKLKAFSTPGGHFRIDPASLETFLRSSGIQGGKKKVWLVRLSPVERKKLLENLAGDEAFSVSEETSGEERPCLILLDAGDGGGKKKASSTDLHARLRRWCGVN